MLEVIEEYSKIGSGYFQTVPILREVAKRCGTSSLAQEQVVLTVWGDLFRSGLLGEGHDLSNPSLPFCHLTSRGREALRNISRDPANPDGYIAYVASRANLDDVSRSYLFEAVHTFNSASFKSAAVMIGAAAESLILRLRDKLANQLATTDLPLPAGLSDWRIKTARDALTVFFDGKKKTMPRKLREAYEAYWLAFAEQIRRVRNDAGHPQSVDPVSEEAVHASLLIFPELAHLVCDLEAWIEG
jgi:hypothetical protein